METLVKRVCSCSEEEAGNRKRESRIGGKRGRGNGRNIGRGIA
jgi:hypothetical protein